MRPASLQVDLDAIRTNVRAIRALLPPHTQVAAVVKANAYGHGAVAVSHACLDAGVNMLCVAIPDEGVELRQAGIGAPILVLGPPDAEEARLYVEHDLASTVSEPSHATMLAEAAKRAGRPARVHVKLDSGMGRHGARPAVAGALARILAGNPHLSVEGLFSHFADACNPDLSWSRGQLERFRSMVEEFGGAGAGPRPLIHMANSAGIVRLPGAHFDAVRPGAILYGMNPGFDPELMPGGIRPALELRCRIGALKPVEAGAPVGYNCSWHAPRNSRIAVLPVGYADGYPRALSNNAEVLVGGRRCPLVGMVSMDAVTVDVTDVPAAAIGDEAVLMGAQGAERITVEELARRAGSIVEEIAGRLSRRLPRTYVNGSEGR